MSTNQHGQHNTTPAERVLFCGFPPDWSLAVDASLGEARAILVETEPKGMVLHAHVYGMEPVDGAAILAESLAAFLTLDLP